MGINETSGHTAAARDRRFVRGCGAMLMPTAMLTLTKATAYDRDTFHAAEISAKRSYSY